MTGVLGALTMLAVAPLPPPPQPPVRYIVRPGDTLIALAARWFVRRDTWPDVQRLNRLTDPYRLRIGSTLSVPRVLLKVEPLSGKVIAFRGPVTMNGRPAVLGAIVSEGMTIGTGADASVTVELTDESRFSLPSQTRLGIARLRRVLLTGDVDRVFTTAAGRGEWRVSPAPTPDSRFLVTTPVSVSAVRGTGFRVGYEDGAAVGVVEGNVRVSDASADAGIPIPKGKGVAVRETGVGAPVALLRAPEIVRAGATQAGAQLAFAVRPVAGARSYVFEIGTDAGLVDRVGERRGTPGSVAFDALADGSYFVRATATDPSGIDGFSTTVAFERLALGTAPPQAFGRGMRFKWSSSGAAGREYRFTLYADEAATRALIDRPGLRETQFTVTDLRPGTYWWRVAMTKFGGAQPVVATGDIQSFTIASP